MSKIIATTAGNIQVGDTIIVNDDFKVFAVALVPGTAYIYCEGRKEPFVRPIDGLIYREVAE